MIFNPHSIIEVARGSLVERIMALAGRSAASPRAERTRLEHLSYAELEREHNALEEVTLGEVAD